MFANGIVSGLRGGGINPRYCSARGVESDAGAKRFGTNLLFARRVM